MSYTNDANTRVSSIRSELVRLRDVTPGKIVNLKCKTETDRKADKIKKRPALVFCDDSRIGQRHTQTLHEIAHDYELLRFLLFVFVLFVCCCKICKIDVSIKKIKNKNKKERERQLSSCILGNIII